MIRPLCSVLLQAAARRWPPDTRDDLLSEWRAELHASSGMWQRLRFAGSLAASRPHRAAPVLWTPRSVLGAAASVVVLLGTLAYARVAVAWTSGGSSGTIGWQSWVGAISMVAAILLGFICARFTSGVTQLVRLKGLPFWTFGIIYAALLFGEAAYYNGPDKAALIDNSLWLMSGVVFSLAAVWLTRSRRSAAAWVAVGVGTLLTYWFGRMHGSIFYYAEQMGLVFGLPLPASLAFTVGTSPAVHITLFCFVYTQQLARLPRRLAA